MWRRQSTNANCSYNTLDIVFRYLVCIGALTVNRAKRLSTVMALIALKDNDNETIVPMFASKIATVLAQWRPNNQLRRVVRSQHKYQLPPADYQATLWKVYEWKASKINVFPVIAIMARLTFTAERHINCLREPLLNSTKENTLTTICAAFIPPLLQEFWYFQCCSFKPPPFDIPNTVTNKTCQAL